MKSNTEFNKYKVKNDELYLSKSGGKVEGETVFTGGVRFSSGDPKNDLVIKDKTSLNFGGSAGGGWVLSMYVDANGDLYAVMVDGSDPSIFHYDDATGNLYYVVT